MSNPRRCIKQDSEHNTLPNELFRPPSLTYTVSFAGRIRDIKQIKTKTTKKASKQTDKNGKETNAKNSKTQNATFAMFLCFLSFDWYLNRMHILTEKLRIIILRTS